MKVISLLTAAMLTFAGLALAPKADAQVIKIDGSSTVFPITEAVAEEFQKSEAASQGHGRHLRHRRRLQEVLPRRDRHLGRLAPDPASRDGGLQAAGIEYYRAADRLRRSDGRGQPAEHLGHAAHDRGAQEDVGAGGAGQDHALEPGQPDLAGRAAQAVRARAPTPAPSTTSPRPSIGKAKSSRGDYTASEDDNVLVQGVARDENAIGYFGYAYYVENQDKLKAVPIVGKSGKAGRSVARERGGRHLPAAVPPDLHLRRRESRSAARGEGVRRILPGQEASR